MAKVKPGAKVPDFSLPSTTGTDFRLADAKDKWLVLYFYPKDATSGCTTESQEFRDLHAKFRRAGAMVLGVSRDSLKSHDKFRDKEALPALRRHPREKPVRPQVHGYRTQHVPDRQFQCSAPRMAQGEGCRPCPGSPRSPPRLSPQATRSAACTCSTRTC